MFERKVDGYGMLAYKDRGIVCLVSRRGIDHVRRYPDLAAATRCRSRGPASEVLIAGAKLVLPARRLARIGLKACAPVTERGYEGLVGKDHASPYEGGLTTCSLKVKQPDWVDRACRTDASGAGAPSALHRATFPIPRGAAD